MQLISNEFNEYVDCDEDDLLLLAESWVGCSTSNKDFAQFCGSLCNHNELTHQNAIGMIITLLAFEP